MSPLQLKLYLCCAQLQIKHFLRRGTQINGGLERISFAGCGWNVKIITWG